MTEQLTDEEREILRACGIGETVSGQRLAAGVRAIDVIDANAADRAALVAQLEAANGLLERGKPFVPKTNGVQERWRNDVDAHLSNQPAPTHAALVAQVAELTRERDSWRRTAEKLTRERDEERAAMRELRDIERHLRSSSANRRIAAAIDAIESARLATGGVESAWAKQALRALRGDAR